MSDVVRAVENPERLTALRHADLLDTPPEEAFDQLTGLAARLLDAPIAFVSLVDKDRQFFKSCIGPVPEPTLSQRQTPLSHSFCQYTIALQEPLLIEDAREHPVLKDSPAVHELGVVAYAGIPLITPERHALGTLCVVDSKPRQWTGKQIETLRSLAASVMSTISYRAAARARRAADDQGTDTPPPFKSDTLSLSEAGKALAQAASEYLNCVDKYGQVVQSDAVNAAVEYQNAILNLERRFKQAADDFHEQLNAVSDKPDDPSLNLAIELWRTSVRYFDAEKRRTAAVTRFQEVGSGIVEVEREIMIVSEAEQAIRLALRTYELQRR